MTALSVSVFTYCTTTAISVAVSGIVWFMGKVFSKLSRKSLHAEAHTASADDLQTHDHAQVAAAISAAVLASRRQQPAGVR